MKSEAQARNEWEAKASGRLAVEVVTWGDGTKQGPKSNDADSSSGNGPGKHLPPHSCARDISLSLQPRRGVTKRRLAAPNLRGLPSDSRVVVPIALTQGHGAAAAG